MTKEHGVVVGSTIGETCSVLWDDEQQVCEVIVNGNVYYGGAGIIVNEIKDGIELLDTYGVLTLGTSQFLFDAEDLPLIESRSWYCDKDGYLVSCYYYAGVKRFVRFHRIVMNAKPYQCVDHINRNRADNRKQNLRCCEYADNDRYRGLYSTNTSGVAGVYFDSERNKWVASISYNSKRIYIGRFNEKDDAIKARLNKEIELFKEFAPQRALWEAMNMVL